MQNNSAINIIPIGPKFQGYNFSILDLETTGGSPYFDRVTEVGLLKIENGELVKTFHTLVNPEVPIPEFITQITGITNSHVAGAPKFSEIEQQLEQLLLDTTLVAHNSDFDYGFLAEEYRRIGKKFSMKSLCTVKLSRALFPEHKRHNLDSLIERFEFSIVNRHRALDDATILWEFLNLLPSKFPQEQIDKTIAKLTRK